jgi:hypothetical protein
MLGIFWNISYITVRKTKDMGLHLPEKFRAAIEKGVRDILQGELRKLNISEKRQLLADLRERGDCPPKWKNIDPKKQQSIPECLNQAIYRLSDPEKAKAASARNAKKRKENGKQEESNARNGKKRRENGKAQEYTKKIKENGKQKAASAIFIAKRAKATREANARAILENKDHHEATWDEDTIEKEATGIVEYIVKRCGRNGFVHVCGGAWPGMTVNEAAEAECFGRGGNRHAVFIDDSKFVRYRDVSTHVELFTPYTGTNCLNADGLEKRVQTKLIDMGWPQHRRMFVCKGKGSCKGKREAGVPFPYYTGVLVCEQSMEQIGIRLATKKDHAPKRKRASSSL